MASDVALHAVHLCSGYAGFELALRLAGLDVRTVAHVERDSYAAATLVARMEDQALDQAPVWDDLTTFDGRQLRGVVDLVTAGFPCQPWSSAGQQQGVEDERWIWPDIARLVDEIRPRLVFLENVPGLLAHDGLGSVLSDLARLGFDAEWSLLSAADLGAPHRRERLWILAYADRDGLRGQWGQPEYDGHARHDADRCSGAQLADASSIGRHGRTRQGSERHQAPGHRARSSGGRAWPPSPADADGWRAWTAAGGPQPSVRRVTDGRPEGLADALHLGGNGLVPVVAAAAFLMLAERAGLVDRRGGGVMVGNPNYSQGGG